MFFSLIWELGAKRPKICSFAILLGPKKLYRSLENLSFFSSNLQFHVHLFPLHLGSCLTGLWIENDATGRDGWFWKNCPVLTVLVQVDLPNIETGSPHMSGTVRDKIFVGQVSRKRNARECQEWCQVNKPENQDVGAFGKT